MDSARDDNAARRDGSALSEGLGPAPRCPECNDTGERDSGGTHPWGEPIYLACDCKDTQIGRRWRQDSSLEAWFPITAQRLWELQDENERLRAALGPDAQASRPPTHCNEGGCMYHGQKRPATCECSRA